MIAAMVTDPLPSRLPTRNEQVTASNRLRHGYLSGAQREALAKLLEYIQDDSEYGALVEMREQYVQTLAALQYIR